ncbi:MAG: hypothetical protein M5U26_25215 [Planctomycetota bacterium]|nr:hypothetical protein [Planctomycetota bacterium]
MPSALRALLSEIVDYAGLFPPAKLPLEQAFSNFARYRAEPETWMLGRFVIPAARLAELDAFHELLALGAPFGFAALGRGGAAREAWLEGLREDLEALASFLGKHGARARVDVFEVKLPDELLGEAHVDALCDLLTAASEMLEDEGPANLTPFYELARREAWREECAAALAALAATNAAETRHGRKRSRPAGFKLRTGGLEAAAFPSPEQAAFAIHGCREAGVALKCTAGLHHPVRHFNASVNAKMHGFLNVFGAAVLAREARLDEPAVRAILEEEDPAAFRFEDGRLACRGHAVAADRIKAARAYAASFGSCSFDEPREDLRNLGLLNLAVAAE